MNSPNNQPINVTITQKDSRENSPVIFSRKSSFKSFFRLGPTNLVAFILIGFLLLVLAGGFGFYFFRQRQADLRSNGFKQKNIQLDFVLEIYDKIKENYWEKISDAQLTELYELGSEKILNKQFDVLTKDKNGVSKLYFEATANMDEAKKKEFTLNLSTIVLANLKPFGRSGLFNQKQQQQLAQTVQNINPDKNLYSDLGVEKQASKKDIKTAYENQSQVLKNKPRLTPEEKKKLDNLEYAYGILSQPEQKQTYDTYGAEPTVFTKIIGPSILHVYINRFSPTTFDEFTKAGENADKTASLDTLILDLRGNIGGAIDILPYFLGPFIGYDQYAYEFYHQGEKTPFKTKLDWLPTLIRYKKVIILIDNETQSTAELMASVLKKYNVGLVVGNKSKGWGTIEKVFDLQNQIDPQNEKYGMFLVHTLTLRDDNQPVQDNGVEPNVDINKKDWQKEINSRYNDARIVEAIAKIWKTKPN